MSSPKFYPHWRTVFSGEGDVNVAVTWNQFGPDAKPSEIALWLIQPAEGPQDNPQSLVSDAASRLRLGDIAMPHYGATRPRGSWGNKRGWVTGKPVGAARIVTSFTVASELSNGESVDPQAALFAVRAVAAQIVGPNLRAETTQDPARFGQEQVAALSAAK